MLIYLFALPLTWLRDYQVRGEVEREDPTRHEDTPALGTVEREAIIHAVRAASGEKPPPASPSARECRYCDILHCPHRYKKPEANVGDLW